MGSFPAMDSFEWNKIIGAVLGTAIFIFVVRLVADLIAALRQRNMCNEDYGHQCERAPLHCFPKALFHSIVQRKTSRLEEENGGQPMSAFGQKRT